MNIGDYVKGLSLRFKESGIENPALDAEILVSHFLDIERYRIVSDRDRPMTAEEIKGIDKLAARRMKFEPVAYITGMKEFYSLDFQVTRDVLIPRPETELLVDMGIYWTEQGSRVLDLCTGSGCVAVALKYSRDDLDIYASDISDRALRIAKRNARRVLGEGKIEFRTGNLFESFPSEKFRLIISNPPYVDPSLKDKLQREISFEPEIALFTGNGGKEIIGKIIEQSVNYLEEKGVLLLEIGSDQGEYVTQTGEKYGYHVTLLNDYSGHTRVATLRL